MLRCLLLDDAQSLGEPDGDGRARVPVKGEVEAKTPGSLANAAARAANGNPGTTLLFLNLHLLCKGFSDRRQLGGLEVLKRLRMDSAKEDEENGRRVHVVAYSFLEIEDVQRLALAQQTSAFLLVAPGHTYVRMPCDLSEYASERRASRLADTSHAGLVPFLRGGAVLPDEEHSWANWYGAWQMLRVHEHITDHRRPAPQAHAIGPKTPRARDTVFVHGMPDDLVEEATKRGSDDRSSSIKRALGSSKIGVIDDQADCITGLEYGWTRVHARVLLDQEDGVVDVLNEAGHTGGFISVSRAEELLGHHSFDSYACLLLDLRLNDDPRGMNPYTLSGAQLLRWLRQHHPTLPVILTTASNKATSREVLMRLGADGFWNKPRIEAQGGAEDLVLSYLSLQKLVARTLSEPYQLLRWYGRALSHIREQQPPFWPTAAWLHRPDKGGRTLQERHGAAMHAEAVQRLEAIQQMLRQYVQQTHLSEDGGWGSTHTSLLTTIFLLGGQITELVHRLRNEKASETMGGGFRKRGGTTAWRVGRGDWLAHALIGMRNKAAHFTPNPTLGWLEARIFLRALIHYVFAGPQMRFARGHELRPRDKRWTSNDLLALETMLSENVPEWGTLKAP